MSETGLAGRLTEFGHAQSFRVYFEDTDFSGVVYHARYLHFLERARTDFLRLKGIGHRALMEGAFGEPMAFAVRHMEIDFLAPARIDDVVVVETRTVLLGGARVVLDQKIYRGEILLVAARVKVAVISPDGRPRRMPRAVAAILDPAFSAPKGG
ncbi:tol-pal system-associated acyl-CoA thioesterase [Aureimonas leprariae]|uniref:Tol-pal system-associated acyl-CoA thioesterase n=1 Tax=Plantimonas leprariae TaxID=2615207 RepID=A0A7V7PMG0_9HYPH|nr:tol-pal system-associated acyl-CoA thioesterase [Aureimonas leprariae]KAB0678016.1 tol-pal system-associated acyl-CoA thioesterase [Aureimonas leprariae]